MGSNSTGCNGNRHPKSKNPTKFWDRVLGSMVSDAYEAYAVRYLVHKQVVKLVVLIEKYHSKFSVDKKLPSDFEKDLSKSQTFSQSGCTPPSYLSCVFGYGIPEVIERMLVHRNLQIDGSCDALR
jgi:hypothetical protein